jgi:hypothetical protein
MVTGFPFHFLEEFLFDWCTSIGFSRPVETEHSITHPNFKGKDSELMSVYNHIIIEFKVNEFSCSFALSPK